MQFAEGAVDYGDAVETHVSGIASINKISEHMIRVTFFTEKGEGENFEKRTTVHLVWDMARWINSHAETQQAMAQFIRDVLVQEREVRRQH